MSYIFMQWCDYYTYDQHLTFIFTECHRQSGWVHSVDLLAIKELDHIFALVWGSSGRLGKATWPNFFQCHRSSAIWPYAKFHPRHHRSHPRPNQSKWYSVYKLYNKTVPCLLALCGDQSTSTLAYMVMRRQARLARCTLMVLVGVNTLYRVN